MADDKPSAPVTTPPTTPELDRLRIDVERAKLEKELAEQGAGKAKALVGDWSGVTAPTDTVTISPEAPAGLADVHASRAAVNVADDIADLAWDALNEQDCSNAQILVVGSASVIADCDTYWIVRSSLDQMMERVGTTGSTSDQYVQDLTINSLAGNLKVMNAVQAAIPVLTTALPAVAGVVSKLLGRTYTVSGKTPTGLDDLGFDLQLASEVLQRTTTATVRVGRLTPMPSTVLFEDVRLLATALQGPLAVRLATAEARLALHTERAKQAQASLDAARSQIAELVKQLTPEDDDAPSPALTVLAGLQAEADLVRVELLQTRAQRRQSDPTAHEALDAAIADLDGQQKALREQIVKAVGSLAEVDDTGGATPRIRALKRALDTEEQQLTRLPALRAAEAGVQTARDELKQIHDEGVAFLAQLLAVSGDEPPPLIRAGRVEQLVTVDKTKPQVILMARVLRAGVDQVLETKVGSDDRSVLAGITVEWALLRPTGQLLACGVRTGLRASEGSIGGLGDLQERDILYVGVPRRREQRSAVT